MDTRRRTLAADPAALNAPARGPRESMIPVPGSAMKASSFLPASTNSRASTQGNGPTRGLRMSVAGPGRQSVLGAGNAIGGNGGLRESQQSSDGGLAGARRSTVSRGLEGSGSRGDAGFYGRSSVVPPGSVRRVSSYSSMRQSLAPSSHPGASAAGSYSRIEDSRKPEYRNPVFQKACRDNIEDYLMTRRYPHSLGPKALQSPTQKEFQQIFRFLINDRLDPNFIWGKSFESDCMTIIRDMRYPSPEQISKTSLGAAGGPTAWPALLAMLDWLTSLSRALERWQDPESGDPAVLDLANVDDEYEGFEEKMAYEYYSRAYNEWFDGAEEFPVLETDFKGRTYARTDRLIQIGAEIETKWNKTDTQLKMLQSVESPLGKASHEEENLLSDKSKFVRWIEAAEEKVNKHKLMNQKALDVLAAKDQDIAAHERELKRLEAAVAAQNLTPEEITRMTTETATLKETIRELQMKLADGHRQQGEQEIAVTRKMDDIETLSGEYNGLVNKLDLSKVPSESTSRSPIDYSVVVETNQVDLTAVGVVMHRMKEQIRPGLQAVGEQIRGEFQTLANQKIELDDEFDKVASNRQVRYEEMKTMEVKLSIADDQAEQARAQFNEENQDIQRRIAKLEKDVAAMSMSSQQELIALESELESLRVERTETIHAVRNRREKVIADITSHAEAILGAKDHVTARFNELKAFTSR